jgi:hypothetical protein
MIISNSMMILKVTSQLQEHQKNAKRTPNISQLVNIMIDFSKRPDEMPCLKYVDGILIFAQNN